MGFGRRRFTVPLFTCRRRCCCFCVQTASVLSPSPPQWYNQSCWQQQQQAYPATSPEASYTYQHYTPYLSQDPPLHGKTYTLSDWPQVSALAIDRQPPQLQFL